MGTLLAFDLGGTKSRLGIYDLNGNANGRSTSVQAVYKNRKFSGIEEVITRFYDDYGVAADDACIAVAGPVNGDTAELTNLPWRVSRKVLAQQFGFTEVLLLNDLTALAQSIPFLRTEELFTIKEGELLNDGTIAVIAPGTGLGQGYLVPSGDTYIVKGSEGGHSGFSPSCLEELEILRWMINRKFDLSAEQVCAGPGIGMLYRYYEEQGQIEPLDWVKEIIAESSDITPAVVSGATAVKNCPLCSKVVETYLRALGRESANLALKLYARGGVFIGGGVLLHLVGKVPLKPFVQGFQHRTKVSELIEAIPVYGIKKEDALLLGAFKHSLDQLGSR